MFGFPISMSWAEVIPTSMPWTEAIATSMPWIEAISTSMPRVGVGARPLNLYDTMMIIGDKMVRFFDLRTSSGRGGWCWET